LPVNALGKNTGCKRREKTETEDAPQWRRTRAARRCGGRPAATPMAVGGAHPGRQGEMEG
jgi:hypothetical protein